jgi:small subunit ribosomal protein S8
MAATDPLGDMLTRIRKAQAAKKDSVLAPASKLRAHVLDVLVREGYIRGYSEDEGGNHKALRIELKYFEGEPAIKHVARVSKPGRRVYSGTKDLPVVRNGLGITIVSTPQGILSGAEAQARNVHGEVLASVTSGLSSGQAAGMVLDLRNDRSRQPAKKPMHNDKAPSGVRSAKVLLHAVTDGERAVESLNARQASNDEISPSALEGGDREEELKKRLLEQAVSDEQPNAESFNENGAIFQEAVKILGASEALGCELETTDHLLRHIMEGFPAKVLQSLCDAGWKHKDLEVVIAPRRTLMRRKSENARLTRNESDAAWRMAYVLALASDVLEGRAAAMRWLSRDKPAIGNFAPINLLSSSIGTEKVVELLRSLDWGDIA